MNYKKVFQLAQDKGCKIIYSDSVLENTRAKEDEDRLVLFNLVWIQKWLRDEYKIDIDIDREGAIQTPTQGYKVTVYSIKRVLFHWETGGVIHSYEEALLQGIKAALELIP